ncbi:MAG: hypothetical protein WAN47_10900 [Nitrosotalea sp.]
MSENLDFEDAILRSLIREESFRYNELFDEVQTIKKCTTRTFNEHLKKMVKKGIVEFTPPTKKEKGKYWIPSGLKTVNDSIQYWLENELNILDKLTDTVKSTLDFHKKNTRENKKIKSSLMKILVRKTLDWFQTYRILTLTVISGNTAKITEKTIKRFGDSGLSKIKNLFELLEQSDPAMHREFFVQVSNKMVFQHASFR